MSPKDTITMSSGNEFSNPPVYQQPVPQKSNTGLIIMIVAAVMAVPMLIACLGIMVGLLLPAVQAAREAARRMACQNNEKQIALALLNYESVYRSLPPAFTVDANGQPLHSWRTLLLPYLEQNAVYEQIDLNKPWDDPVNLPIGEVVIPTFVCPSSGPPANTSNYVAVIDPSGIFTGSTPTTFGMITDGLANTILFVEVGPDSAVPWMSPDDITMNEYHSLPSKSMHVGGSNVALADGSVRFFSDMAPPEDIEAMISKDGGEVISVPY